MRNEAFCITVGATSGRTVAFAAPQESHFFRSAMHSNFLTRSSAQNCDTVGRTRGAMAGENATH